jgi:UDP-3-O-[3-hydroxymyristoyl] N-acetylglucosamine deacetylase
MYSVVDNTPNALPSMMGTSNDAKNKFPRHSFLNQQTVSNPVIFHGVGVHSGKAVCMIVHPAELDHGIIFERTDIEDKPNRIRANWKMVSSTNMCTTISNSADVSVATVEHILAALFGTGITNALITIDGPEVPIMDGCSEEFCQGLLETSIIRQSKRCPQLKISQTVRVENENGWAQLSPHDTSLFSVQFTPTERYQGLTGDQFQQFSLLEDDFTTLISRARTFGFYEDAQKLWAAGLAKGASLDNTVVIDKGTVMNADGLRYDDELVRHKLLDAIGDMALAEYVLIGHYEACNPGHTLNYQLLKKYFDTITTR